MTNPTIVVKAGARVSIEVINADPDTAHGLVVTASGATSSWIPMLAARPAFTGPRPRARPERHDRDIHRQQQLSGNMARQVTGAIADRFPVCWTVTSC
jgi:hypothetical protein